MKILVLTCVLFSALTSLGQAQPCLSSGAIAFLKPQIKALPIAGASVFYQEDSPDAKQCSAQFLALFHDAGWPIIDTGARRLEEKGLVVFGSENARRLHSVIASRIQAKYKQANDKGVTKIILFFGGK